MKTNKLGMVMGIVAAVAFLQIAAIARADQQSNVKESTSTGTITAIDAANRAVTVRQFMHQRTFNLAEACAISLGNNRAAKLDDLKPGMEVAINYTKANGVIVADRIAQKQEIFTGSVKSTDTTAQCLTLEKRGMPRDFKIAEDCQFVLENGKSAKLNDLPVGQNVTVHYVKENGVNVAEKIANPHATIIGTVTAMDEVADTLKARHLLSHKKFNLADDCKIVINGRSDGQLKDLRLGESVSIDYRDVNGVLIATRIAPTKATSEPGAENKEKSEQAKK